jgi:hypothetical protein
MAFEVRGPLVPEVDTVEELIALKHENSEMSWQWKRLFLGQRMQHSYYLWHELNNQLLNHRHIASVVEIGTGTGALTTLFGLFGFLTEKRVLTIDWDENLSRKLHDVFELLSIETIWGDEWDEDNIATIEEFINGEPTYVFCDGGDKPRELAFWARGIPATSLISVHDWGTEVFPDDVPEGLTPYREDYWNVMNILTATWSVDAC